MGRVGPVALRPARAVQARNVGLAGPAVVVVPPGLAVSIHSQFVLEKLASSLTDGAGELEQGADRRASHWKPLEPVPEQLTAGADRLR